MKKDQYIPHEVSMRNTSEVMNLIEKEGMEGYGIYWALMEYLRTQDDYIGDIEVLKSLARQLRVRLPKLKRIMENYGLFSCTETTFLSPKLVEVMKPFEEKQLGQITAETLITDCPIQVFTHQQVYIL